MLEETRLEMVGKSILSKINPSQEKNHTHKVLLRELKPLNALYEKQQSIAHPQISKVNAM